MNRVDLREFLSAYLAEADEQLHTANGKLLEIDASLRQGEPHPRAVRDLFRALHTIKGLSAMVNVEPAVTIAHRLESIVRVADRSGGHLPLASIDAILEGVHAIEHRVRELADGKPVSAAPAALLATLDALEPAEKTSSDEVAQTLDLDPSLVAKLAPFEVETLVRGAKEGLRALRVDFSPSPAKAEQGLSINSVRERISVHAEIVKVLPVSVPPTPDAPGALMFALLLLAKGTDEEIAEAAGVDSEALRVIVPAARPKPALPPLEVEDDSDASVPGRRSVVRVDVARLDDAMEHLSTLIVTRSRLTRAIARLTLEGVNTRELAEILRDNSRQLRELRSSILRMRMVPVSEVLDRIPLIVRGLQRERGKQVRLAIDAGNAELDKGVAERLFPALVHLVRNSVDHAIETPDARRKLGKPEEGSLRIASFSASNTQLELTVTDDGAGIDRAAVERRVGHEVASGDAALLDAICAPGLSTRETATTTSGRGMGMDIVRRVVVDQLGGDLSLQTERGVGTTFTIRVPLTISIVDSFTLDCRAHRFVVPVSMVEEIMEIERSRVRHGPATGASFTSGLIERRGEAVPLIDLGDALRLAPQEQSAPIALVVRRAGTPLAFALDRVLGQQETVVRPLVDPLVQVPGFSGATDLGDGKPTLVLDLLSLGASLLANGRRAA